jgi:hypothetical protein
MSIEVAVLQDYMEGWAGMLKLGASMHDPFSDSHRQKAKDTWVDELVQEEDLDTGEVYEYVSRTRGQQAGNIKPLSMQMPGR